MGKNLKNQIAYTGFKCRYIVTNCTLKLKNCNFDKCIDFAVKQLRVAYFH